MGWSCTHNWQMENAKESRCPESGGEMEARKTEIAMEIALKMT